MNRQSLRTAGNPGTWLVNRFRVAAEGAGEEVGQPPAIAVAEADEAGDDTTPAVASPATDSDAADPAEPDEACDGDEDAADEQQSRSRNRRRGSVTRAVAAGVLAAVLACAGYEGWLLFQHHQKQVAAEQALDAAKKYILTLTSVDTNAIDKNFADVLDGSTGEFKDMYTKSSAQLRQALIANKAAAHGNVIDAAVQSATQDKVDVVLFVDQSVSNGAAPAPQLDRSRVKMTMEKVDGRWLASKVELP
ncbi:Mce protein [Mycobacterium mantenii]|uniref:Mce protein n=2 Tax=Mycobacterium mantenii TaxID=560555 RepID=A0A1A2SWR2_MYCNT|nr:Mce protein [Mycobacterium mantenii]OBH49812.1 Mce protein [Mycobacterium mantenii]OBH68541.1 Mce protein [Mycobacterium mantenii]OBH75066.1 Mce protein [Mycobacterium mantenii]